MNRFSILFASLTKSLMISGVLVVVSLFAAQISPLLGSLVMFLGSFLLMLKCYRKEWRLHPLTCLIPPVTTGAGYLIQLRAFGYSPAPALMVPAALAGGVLGLLRGMSQHAEIRGGAIFAKKTGFFLIIWFVSYGVMQVFGIARTNGMMSIASLGGMLSCAAMASTSLVMLTKYSGLKLKLVTTQIRPASGLLMVMALGLSAMFVLEPAQVAHAQASNDTKSILEKIVSRADIESLGYRVRKDGISGPDRDDGSYHYRFVITGTEWVSTLNVDLKKFPSAGDARAASKILADFARDRGGDYESLSGVGGGAHSGTHAREEYSAVAVSGSYLVIVGINYDYPPGPIDDAFPPIQEGNVKQLFRTVYPRLAAETGGSSPSSGLPFTAPNADELKRAVEEFVRKLREKEQSPEAEAAMVAALSSSGFLLLAAMLANALNSLGVAMAEGVGAAGSRDDFAERVEQGADRGNRGRPLYDENGEAMEQNEDGQFRWDVGDETRWLSREEAQELVNEELQARADRKSEFDEFNRETKRRSDEWLDRKGEEGLASQQRMAALEQQRNAAEALATKRREGWVNKFRKEFGNDTVDHHLATGDLDGLEDMYRTKMWKQMSEGRSTSETERAWATAFGVGETISECTVTASKAALMTVGGPAGGLATGLGVGAISAAEEGAESHARGDSAGKMLAHTTLGFVSGMKDGATSVYTNLPTTGQIGKVLVPAVGDIAETYIRTGDGKQAATAGLFSVVGDLVSDQADKIPNRLAKEATGALLSGTSAGTMTYINGGDFGEGFTNGLKNHVAAKVGSGLGEHVSRKGITGIPGVTDRKLVPPEEQELWKALGSSKRQRPGEGQTVEQTLDNEPTEIQDLWKTRKTEEVKGPDGRAVYEDKPILGENGKPVVDATGKPALEMEVKSKTYVDESKALDQLMDPRVGRSAKSSHPDIQEAINNTRDDKLYGPANQKTIEAVSEIPEVQEMLKPGDKIVMDQFSTPDLPQSVGADRDARLCIMRPNPKAEGGYDLIEIKREHWEGQAYKDFYEHTKGIAKETHGEITEASHPEYFNRLDELQCLKRPDSAEAVAALKARGFDDDQITKFQQQGLSSEEIEHRAWAEAHNQLFTDKHHVEASADNADQGTIFARGENGQFETQKVQTRGSVSAAKAGEGQLQDPVGFAKMWEEKSRFYSEMPSEAVAQSQKGIAQYLKLREGYRAQGLEPPPIKPEMLEAMKLIGGAQVDLRSNDEQVRELALGLREVMPPPGGGGAASGSDISMDEARDGINDALRKVALNAEYLKYSEQRPEFGSASVTRLVRQSSAMGAGEENELGGLR